MPSSLKRSFKTICLALFLVSGSLVAAEVQDNEIAVAAPQVQQYLDSAFPQDYEALGGLFTLTARDPKVDIPASGQRLRMSFSAVASSPGGDDTPVGRVLMSSGLRYDPQDHAIYLDQPMLDEVQPASPGRRVDEQTRMLLNLWLSDYAGKEPLYRIDQAMLANFDTLQVESTRVENGQIVVRFNQPVAMPDLDDAQD
ncbi:MAG TPA: DUF1439 domain-containing protein [Pseudoxanthomonas sp.]